MPSGITEQDSMMYVRDVPWHGLGTRLENAATAAEAIKAAGLDWNVVTRPVEVNLGTEARPRRVAVPNKAAVLREDTEEVFNVMSEGWTPVQNVEAFNFFDAVVGGGPDDAIYHTAGSLHGGRKVWILAKLPGELNVTNKDVLEKYILLANGHDGSQALTMTMTAVRVVCMNTLNVALGSSRRGSRFYSHHTKKILDRAAEARDVLGLAEAHFEMLMRGINRMAETAMKEDEIRPAIFKIFEIDEDKLEAELKGTAGQAVKELTRLFHEGTGQDLDGARGTRWGMMNAVTEYLDHLRPIGNSVDGLGAQDHASVDKRMELAWFRYGARYKQNAWDLLVPAGADL